MENSVQSELIRRQILVYAICAQIFSQELVNTSGCKFHRSRRWRAWAILHVAMLLLSRFNHLLSFLASSAKGLPIFKARF